MSRWWPAVTVFLAAVLLWRSSCVERNETKQDVEQKAAIALADTQKVEAVKSLRKVRNATNKTLADPRPVLTKPEVKVIVDAERAACDTVLKAGEKQVEARDIRIRTLEKRNGGTLFVYGEAGVRARIGPDPVALFDAEGGIALRLSPTTYLQAGATTRQEVRLSVRKQFKLF